MFKKILIIGSFVIGLVGCASAEKPVVTAGADIVVEGKVLKNTPQTITLKNISGENVLVRTSTEKSFKTNKKIKIGDEIIVHGRVDNDPKEGTIIQAEKINFKK